MRRFMVSVCLIVFAFVCIGCSTTLQIVDVANAPKPSPEMKKLELFVGEWTYEGEQLDTPVEGLPWGPGGKFAGGFESRFVLNGHFMEGRGSEKGPAGEGGFVGISWYDAKTKGYAVHTYLNDGTMYTETARLDGLTYTSSWPISTEDGTEVLVRGVWKFSEDRASFTSTWHLSMDDGNTWKYYAEYRGKKRHGLISYAQR